MPHFGFQRLEVYQLSKALVLQSYRLTREFPSDEKFALVKQINRAAISIPSNVVEGYGRMTAKDKSHFLNMAYSSLMELVCQFEIAEALGYITSEALESIMGQAHHLSVKISNFRQSVGERQSNCKE
jgi:four helix bundle protein